VNPFVKYTLARLGLLLAVLLALLPVPGLGLMVKLLLAVTVSFILSWVLLRRWRDELSVYLAARAQQRRVERERLRATLAGNYPPGIGPGSGDEPGGTGIDTEGEDRS
jgi:uncharacterized protein DUF4229